MSTIAVILGVPLLIQVTVYCRTVSSGSSNHCSVRVDNKNTCSCLIVLCVSKVLLRVCCFHVVFDSDKHAIARQLILLSPQTATRYSKKVDGHYIYLFFVELSIEERGVNVYALLIFSNTTSNQLPKPSIFYYRNPSIKFQGGTTLIALCDYTTTDMLAPRASTCLFRTRNH